MNNSAKFHNSGAGFTLIELMLVLAIMAVLMAAVGIAFNGVSTNHRENDNAFKAINQARQAVQRITAQLRTADAVDPCAPAHECTFVASDGSLLTYTFDSNAGKLYLKTDDDLSDPDYVICDDVSSANFAKSTSAANPTLVKTVQIELTTEVGNATKKICAAAAIRRNIE